MKPVIIKEEDSYEELRKKLKIVIDDVYAKFDKLQDNVYDFVAEDVIDNAVVAEEATALTDGDGDTLVQVEESADDDTFRIDTSGTQRMTINSSGVTTIGGSSNYIEIEADGTLEFKGNATIWNDANMGAAMLSKPAASQPDEDNFMDEGGGDTGITTLAFAIGEKVSGSFEIPHSYKTGTNFTFHVHWQGIAAPSGTDNVQWRLVYTIGRDDETLDAATTVDSTDTAISTQYDFYRSDITEVDGSTKGNNSGNVQMGDQFLFSLERVAATGDAYAGDALVATIGIHYEEDTVGSRLITTK